MCLIQNLQRRTNGCGSLKLLEREVPSTKQLVLSIRPFLTIVVEHLDSKTNSIRSKWESVQQISLKFQSFVPSIELILGEEEVIPVRV